MNSNNLGAKRTNDLLLNLPAKTFRPTSQDTCPRETVFIRDPVATTVHDQTDFAAMGTVPIFLRNQSLEAVKSPQVAEEETQMNLAAATYSRQVRLAVEKTRDPFRVGVKVVQNLVWTADFVLGVQVEFQVCVRGHSAQCDQLWETFRQLLLLGRAKQRTTKSMTARKGKVPGCHELAPAPVLLRYHEAAPRWTALVIFISELATDVADVSQGQNKSHAPSVQLLFVLVEDVVDHVAELRRK